MKILLATQKPFAAAAVKGITDILEAAGHEVAKLEKYEAQADFVAAVAHAEALIIRSDKVTEEVMAAAPKLKIVVRAGAGFDNVDLEAATARGIVVMNTPGQNSNAVAELALGMMIFMARTQFTPATGSELQGKRLGVQAYGNVGRLVGQKAKALGMEVSALDPFLTDEQIIAGGADPVHSLEELYAASDYLSIHIPALPSTIKSIGYDLITKMPKPNARADFPPRISVRFYRQRGKCTHPNCRCATSVRTQLFVGRCARRGQNYGCGSGSFRR